MPIQLASNMKSTLKHLLLFVILGLVTACSKEDVDTHAIVGEWKLTSWTASHIPFDLNHDNITSTNLLDEIDCANNEILVFTADKFMHSDDTFNPIVTMVLLNGITDDYRITAECAEGIIGFSKAYTLVSETEVQIDNNIATINGNQLTIVYENAIAIYNEVLAQVIATKDLTLVYTKL